MAVLMTGNGLSALSKQSLLIKRSIKRKNQGNRIWVKQRTEDFQHRLLSGKWDASDYIENLRVNKTLFDYLCAQTNEDMRTDNTKFRLAVPIEIKVACSLYYLAENCSIRTVKNLFGVGKSTVCKYVHLFCESLNFRLGRKFIACPNNQQFLDIAHGFENHFGMINGSD
uniref:DUF8040 domain-containing protein n=1 Tax=Strigamia maritima TaxID=126957 RepID=T1IK37_STRMM